MKTRIIITAAFIFCIGFASASIPSFITFVTLNGVELVQPVETEEAEEALPLVVEQEIRKNNLAYTHFDITELMKPEEEEPLPFDLQKIFETAQKVD